MMTRKPCWVDSANKPHFTKEECQAAEIEMMIDQGCKPMDRIAIADWIVGNADALLNILTTDETSRPAARKANGATRKPRKPKTLPVIDASETAA